nr:PREDICTED: SPARC-related modular calcium-binding protein 1-like [Notothenia coriiceps]
MVVSFRFFLTLNPDDGSKPTPTMETHVPPEGDEITAPTLWIKQLGYKENKQNSSSSKRQGARERAGRGSAESSRGHFHPGLWPRGYLQSGPVPPVHGLLLVRSGGHGPAHPWNIHQVISIQKDIRYQTPECDGTARSHVSDTEDPFLVKDLPGCADVADTVPLCCPPI